MMYTYSKDGDFFVLSFGEEGQPKSEVYRCEEVAIAYSGAQTGDFRLAKHGRPDLVKTWFSNLGNKMRKADELESFADYMLITSKTIEVDELNKLIRTPDYVEEFVNKMNSSMLDGLDAKNTSE